MSVSPVGIAVIKVIALAEASDLVIAAKYQDCVDLLMFDAKPPVGAQREGGHGTAFDWQILRGQSFVRPWLLAGGLNADNVARAIHTCSPPGVDVSSGVESSLGQKSAELIVRFVANARGAQFSTEAQT